MSIMRYRDAKKLHDGDKVKILLNNEIAKVVGDAEIYADEIYVNVKSKEYGLQGFRHTDIAKCA